MTNLLIKSLILIYLKLLSYAIISSVTFRNPYTSYANVEVAYVSSKHSYEIRL